MFRAIKEWLKAKKSKPLSELLEVRFDEETIQVIVLDELEEEWNQEFRWNDILSVCFQDGGLYSSDVLYFEVQGREKPCMILTEAKGAEEFFGKLTETDELFPEEIWREALGSTDGGMYCWPPKN